MVLLLVIPAQTKDKKTTLPDVVLQAETVYVMIAPDSGMSVTNPGENRAAREAVEEALRKWGHFRVLTYTGGATPPDLIIVVRKGGSKTTITGVDPNDRPATIGSSDTVGDRNINLGVSNGREPRPAGANRAPGPGVGTEVAPPEDVFEVYLAGIRSDPLSSSPIWRYRAKNALNAPVVPALKEFQKQIEEALKEQAQRNKKP